jgi:hypothetical protein
MSIKARPWEGGGAASVPDASETVKGIIRIATSAEATTGTDDTIAMTPLTVKERIDASLVGGVEYKGTFNATTGATSLGGTLANAEKGDMYVVDTAGTIYGQDWNIGDHLLINEDMGGSITNSKIDKIDNTVSDASETVKGIIRIATNTEAGAGSATDKALVPSNVSSLSITSSQVSGLATVATTGAYSDLSGTPTLATVATTGAYSDLSGTPTLGTAAALDVGTNASNVVQLDGSARLPAVDGSLLTNLPSGNQVVDVELQTTSTFTAASNYIYMCGYTSGTQTITFPAASSSTDGDLIALFSNSASRAVNIVSSDGSTNDIVDINNASKGGSSGALSLNIDRQLVWFSPSGSAWRQLNAALATVATTGAYSDLSGTPTLATVATSGAYSDLSGTPTLATVATSGAYSDLSGTPTLGTAAALDVGTGASNVVQLDGSARLPAVDGSQLTNLPSGGLSAVVDDTTPQLGGNLDTNGQSITSASNADVTIDPNGTGDIVVGADVLPAANNTHTLGAEDNRFITLHSELNGAIQFKARNESGGALTKGQAVYISGVSGTVPLISLARANSASTMPAFGLLAADVNNNADVQVITFGNLTDYNTTTYSLSANDTVFVSAATAGALTNTAPTGESNLIQNIGRVVRADASAGIIKVGGAGRSNATPNLDNNKIFVGNSSNQAVSTALSAIDVSAFNDDGTYQPLDAGLTSISGLTTSADKMIYTTASDTYAVADLTSAGRALLDDADAIAQRTTLGLGTVATLDVGTGASNVVQLDGSARLPAVDGSQLTNLPSSGGGWTYSAITADPANAQAGYHYSCTGTFTITLPTSGVSAGEEIRVKNMGTGTITIDPQTSNIDGATTDYVMDIQYGAITLVSTGTHWEII